MVSLACKKDICIPSSSEADVPSHHTSSNIPNSSAVVKSWFIFSQRYGSHFFMICSFTMSWGYKTAFCIWAFSPHFYSSQSLYGVYCQHGSWLHSNSPFSQINIFLHFPKVHVLCLKPSSNMVLNLESYLDQPLKH